jgi:hypothetical protein
VEYTRTLFARGRALVGRVAGPLSVDIDMFSRGGLAVLDAIEALGYNTIEHRPELSRRTQVRLLGRALASRLFLPFQRPGAAHVDASPGAGPASSSAQEAAESKHA